MSPRSFLEIPKNDEYMVSTYTVGLLKPDTPDGMLRESMGYTVFHIASGNEPIHSAWKGEAFLKIFLEGYRKELSVAFKLGQSDLLTASR